MMRRLATTIGLAMCCSCGGLALADETAGDLMHDTTAQLTPLADNDLAVQRARGSGDTINIGEINVQLSDIGQKAKLDHNIVESSVTGGNTVSNGSFAGASGLATVIQNSGNNVIIQNATIVNYSVHP